MGLLFEDIVDSFSEDEFNDYASKEIMPLEEFTDATDSYKYCMGLVLHMNFSKRHSDAGRGQESLYRFPMNLQLLVEKMTAVVEQSAFPADVIFGKKLIIYTSRNKGEEQFELTMPLPEDFKIWEHIPTYLSSNKDICFEYRMYFDDFGPISYEVFSKALYRMHQSLYRVVIPNNKYDYGRTVFMYNTEPEKNINSYQCQSLDYDSYFKSSPITYGWTSITYNSGYQALYRVFFENERIEDDQRNFMEDEVIDGVDFDLIIKYAIKKAAQRGVTLIPGTWAKPDMTYVYQRDLDKSFSYITFTAKLDQDEYPLNSIDVYELEDIILEAVVNQIPDYYLDISPLIVAVRGDYKLTNVKIDEMRKERQEENKRLNRWWADKPVRIEHKEKVYVHQCNKFTYVTNETDYYTTNGKRPCWRIRNCHRNNHTLSGFTLAFPNMRNNFGIKSRLSLYSADHSEEFINDIMPQEEVWGDSKKK